MYKYRILYKGQNIQITDWGDHIELEPAIKTIHMITQKRCEEATSWDKGKIYAENLSTGNYTDWRLPTTDELQIIYDIKNNCRINYDSDLFWASEKPHDKATGKWLVDFKNSTEVYCKSDDLILCKNYVICVR